MRNWAFLGCLVAGSFLSFGACGDAEGDDNADKGAAGSGGSSNDEVIQNPDPPNLDCPLNDIGPQTGPYAPSGKCCYRTSNKARIKEDSSERILQYRLNYFLLINQQKTIDPALLGSITINRFDGEEQSILFQFKMPQENGKVVKGPGKTRIGAGRYNCDGTYSYYSQTAAPPDVGTKDPARWHVPELDSNVDPSKPGKDLTRSSYEMSLPLKNKPNSLPYLDADGKLDWEGSSQGFDIIEMPTGDDHLDCVGSRKESKWEPAGKTIAYGRLDLNDTDTIDQLGVNFCQLMAFGRAEGAADHKCLTTPRCEPGSQGCPWQRLPDSLCPVTDDEKKAWGCHLGYGGNPDNGPVKLNCTKDAPKDINPDKGTSEGQCCDPLAKGTDGLPACNAWLQINDFVAAAVKITPKDSDTLQENCHGR